jgi:Na+-driven multidrug efflux pump
MKKILEVGFFEKRNFKLFWPYMKVAGPSVLSMIVEFLTFDIQVFLMGLITVVSQASMVIYMNLSLQIFSIYFGIQTANSTLAG